MVKLFVSGAMFALNRVIYTTILWKNTLFIFVDNYIEIAIKKMYLQTNNISSAVM